MHSLLILAQNAGPNEPKAGHRLAFEFAKQTAKSGKLDIVLLLNRNDLVDYSIWRAIGAEVIYIERFGFLKKLIAILQYVFRIPPRYCTRISENARQCISDIVTKSSYDEVIFEFSQAMPYVDVVNSHSGAKTLASVHDVQLQLVLRGGVFERTIFASVSYNFEKDLINKFDTVYVLCEKDKNILMGLFLCQNVTVRLPIIDNRYSQLKRDPYIIEKGSMVFWGAMDRKENEEAVKNFIKKVFPKIKKKVPYARLYVVGNNPPKSLIRMSTESVVITGFVDDPSAYFNKAQIGVVPLLRGGGVKIKTLEMLSAGLPVVATDIGAEGIDKTSKLTIENIDSFEGKVISLLGNKSDDN